MPERLKQLGLVGLTIFFMVLLAPVALLSFVITVKIGYYALLIGVMLAALGYVLVLPATTMAALTGNSENPRFIAAGVGITLAVVVAGIGWMNVQGNEAKAEFRAGQLARVEAGELYLCDHPESSGNSPMTYPADHFTIRDLVQVNGWTCYEGAGELSYPVGAGAYSERIVNYLKDNGYE